MLSIVIPTLNEAQNLPGVIAHTRSAARGEPIEIIVSDCDSGDGTPDVARSLGVTLTCGGTCRADACNRGAAIVGGDGLLFLHADTLLPDDFARRIRQALRRPGIVGGAFDFSFADHPLHCGLNRPKLQLVVWCNHVRYRWSRNFYGDQAIFVRREAFDAIGGFPRWELMEDVHFSRRMNRCGRTAILSPGVLTSPRRFVTRGVLTQLLIDMVMVSCDSFGVKPMRLWEGYNGWNRDECAHDERARLGRR